MEYILEVEDVNKKLSDGISRGFEIEDISFKLKPGYIMGFIGPNGSGKTTTIKLLMNLIKKDSGSIKMFGMDHVKNEKQVKDRIGFVYDESHFYENLSMKDMKDIIAPFYSKWDEEVFQGYMGKFDLNENQKIDTLSKGMKMKYALAIALSHHAELIIMDEPTAGLDPIFRREILDTLQEFIMDENKSIFFSTHVTTDLDKIADYITFIDDGKIVLSESKDFIMEEYQLIKGGNSDLTEDVRNICIGLRETRVGFEALIKTKDKEYINTKDMIFEEPVLEDIMYYICKEG